MAPEGGMFLKANFWGVTSVDPHVVYDVCILYHFASVSEVMCTVSREPVYGNVHGGGGSQPPLMIVFYKHYRVMDPMWNVRHLGQFFQHYWSGYGLTAAPTACPYYCHHYPSPAGATHRRSDIAPYARSYLSSR